MPDGSTLTAAPSPRSSGAAAHLLAPSVARVAHALACPACRGAVAPAAGSLVCTACAGTYPVRDGVPILLDRESAGAIAATRGRAENVALRAALGRSPAVLRVLDQLRPPHPFAFMRRRVSRAQRAAFSRLAAKDGERAEALFLDVGSGILGGMNASGLSPYVTQHTVPLEIAPTSGVGVVGDAHKLPFADNSVDGVLIQGVLEHVADPARIVAEIRRVLRPGAPVFAEVPFLQHYHLDPVDYRRWTHFGFADLFGAFDVVDAGVGAGPASALADILTEFPALLFTNPKLYWGVKAIAGWLVAPIQLLDVFWARVPRAHVLAGAVYVLARKPAAEA